VDEDKIQDEDDVMMWNDAEDEAGDQAGDLEEEEKLDAVDDDEDEEEVVDVDRE